jgi:hypothetical protein
VTGSPHDDADLKGDVNGADLASAIEQWEVELDDIDAGV